jgi:LPS sulfotransferase NodH
MTVGQIQSSYLICGGARTGTNLLAAALRGTGAAGWPLEYFNTPTMNDANMLARLGLEHIPADMPDVASRLELILAAGTHKGTFGATVHWWDVDNLLAALSRRRGRALPKHGDAADGLRACLPRLRYIWLTRNNKVAQAISHYRALKTGAWYRPSDGGSMTAEAPEVPYDFAALSELVVTAQVEAAGWRSFLRGCEAVTLSLTYEEIAADYAGAIVRAAAFIGVPLAREAVPPPAFHRQADARSREWENRYRAEERAASARA